METDLLTGWNPLSSISFGNSEEVEMEVEVEVEVEMEVEMDEEASDSMSRGTST